MRPGGLAVVVEAVEGPAAVGGVFDVDFTVHDVAGLVKTALVDGAPGLRFAELEDEGGLVGPDAGFEERGVGFGVDEDAAEHVVRRVGAGRVAHVEAGGEIDPLAIVRRELELVGGGVRGARGRLVVGGRQVGGQRAKDRGEQERLFRSDQHEAEYAVRSAGKRYRRLRGSGIWLHRAGKALRARVGFCV